MKQIQRMNPIQPAARAVEHSSINAHPKRYQCIGAPATVCGANSSIETVGHVLSTAVILDRHCYEELIRAAAACYEAGIRTLQLDLQQTERIEQSGLYALYCVHLLFQGVALPEHEGGIAALRYVTERVQLDGHQRVTLVNVSSQVAPLVDRAGFRRRETGLQG